MDLLNNNKNKKGKQGMTIISSTQNHGGFGAGMVNMSDLSSVIIDVKAQEAFIDMGAIHAKSKVERRIKFTADKDEVPNGKPYWIVWVAAGRSEAGTYYHGVTACYMEVDEEARRGYKLLAEHVNRMDYALKGRVIVDVMDDASRELLRTFLIEHNEEMWNRSPETLKQAFEKDASES